MSFKIKKAYLLTMRIRFPVVWIIFYFLGLIRFRNKSYKLLKSFL